MPSLPGREHERLDAADGDVPDLDLGEPHRRRRDDAVRGRDRPGVVARRDADAGKPRVLMRQGDEARAGVDEHAHALAVERRMDHEMAAQIRRDDDAAAALGASRR